MIKENYRFTTLPNGIRIITENLPHVSSFSLGFWFNTGSKNENQNSNGISHFTEHMLFKGTAKRSTKKISDDVEKLGGYLNAFTSKEHTCYYGRGVGEHLPKVFDVLSDMIQNPLFKKSDIKKESGVIIDEYYDIEDSPEELIFDRFETNVFDSHPLHYPIIGTEKNIKLFQQKDFIDYLHKHYTTNNLVVSATGNVNHEKIVELVEKKIIGLKKGRVRSEKSVEIKKPKSLFIQKDIQQTHVIIGKKTFGFKNKDRLKVNLLSNIIGEGSSSRLFNLLREKNGLTYQINTFLNSFKNYSSFGVYFSTGGDDKRAVDLVYKEFDKILKKGITKREFNRAKEYMKGNLIMHLENTTNRMIRMSQSMFYFDKIRKIKDSVNNINAISYDEIVEISKNLLELDSFSKVVISAKEN
ncbi:MAG: insulinase family protein [Melioribacteraceae bacterium]|nr:insulinase family protein [Melioribacteraceae bacterium]